MSFSDIVNQLVDLINKTIPVLIALGLLAFFIGVVRFISQTGDAKGRQGGKDLMLWGLVALFVLVSVWGIVDFASTTLFGQPVGQAVVAP